jgi:hypothetical protein
MPIKLQVGLHPLRLAMINRTCEVIKLRARQGNDCRSWRARAAGTRSAGSPHKLRRNPTVHGGALH